MGETLAPYVTFAPLKAVLPFKKSEWEISIDADEVSRINMASLERRMRDRWRTISSLWERNKQPHNKLDLLANLDHYGKLSSQLEWRRNPANRPVRVVYSKAGHPTAALLEEKDIIVDHLLYWITCKAVDEAYYLLAIINSETLKQQVARFMSKGQFGARDLHKQLWKLPIPEFDADDPLHVEISEAGKAAARGAAQQLSDLRAQRGNDVSVTIVRRELRAWLRASAEGAAVEGAVGQLLG